MMGETTRINLGGRFLMVLPLVLAEASVAAAAEMLLPGAVGGAQVPPMPDGGKVLGFSIGSEALADVVVAVSIDGTPDATSALTLAGAEGYQWLDSPVEFDAGEVVGLQVTTDTTSKDLHALVFIALDVDD